VQALLSEDKVTANVTSVMRDLSGCEMRSPEGFCCLTGTGDI
jgi:hypothetical protein